MRSTPIGFDLFLAMALPGLELHALKGDRKDSWAIRVSGNWRITFIFSGSDVKDVDYEDYH
jgi:proteic killer suppression protein